MLVLLGLLNGSFFGLEVFSGENLGLNMVTFLFKLSSKLNIFKVELILFSYLFVKIVLISFEGVKTTVIVFVFKVLTHALQN